jgi:hypothetical protein
MNDRGEKIVSLAREMLSSDDGTPTTHRPEPNKMASQVKAICVAAFIAAFGSQLVTHMIDQTRRPLNRYEKTELEALIFYASQTKALDPTALRAGLLTTTAHPSIDDLTFSDFEKARDYLQTQLR